VIGGTVSTKPMSKKQMTLEGITAIARTEQVKGDLTETLMTDLINIHLRDLRGYISQERQIKLPSKSYPLHGSLEKAIRAIDQKIKNRTPKDVKMSISEYLENGQSEARLRVALACVVSYGAIKFDQGGEQRRKELIKSAAELVRSHIEPGINQLGGWEQFIENSIDQEEDFEELNHEVLRQIEELCRKMMRPRRTKGIPKLNQAFQLILILVQLLSQVPVAQAILGWDCDNMKIGKQQYSLLDTEECPEAEPQAFISIANNTHYYVYQEAEYEKIKLRECTVFRQRVIFNCGYRSWSSIVEDGLDKTLERIPGAACRDAFYTRKIVISATDSIDANVNAITYTKIYRAVKITGKDGTCESGTWDGQDHRVVRDTYEAELKEYDGWYDTETGYLKQHPNCQVKDGYCNSGLSTLTYEIPKDKCSLMFLREGNFDEYQGKLYKNHFKSHSHRFRNREERERYMQDLLKEEEKSRVKLGTEDTPIAVISRDEKLGMRFVKRDSVVRCDTTMFSTNYKGFFLSTTRVHEVKEARVGPTEMKWEAYVNNKLSFFFNRQEQKAEQIYMEMIANDCKLNREILRVKIGFSTVNIDSVIPLLPLQPGQFGRNVGEVMYVYQCTQVDVEMQPMRDKCYKELPVWHNNATRFLQPVTRLILPLEFIPINMTCSNVLQPIYRDINGR